MELQLEQMLFTANIGTNTGTETDEGTETDNKLLFAIALAGTYLYSGNENKEYSATYQERKSSYFNINNQRPIFVCEVLEQAKHYETRIQTYNQQVDLINQQSGLSIPLLDPLFLVQNLVTGRLDLINTVKANGIERFRKFVGEKNLIQLSTDQLTPFEMSLLRGFLQRINPKFETANLLHLEKQAYLNARFNNKAEYFELVKKSKPEDLPPHTRTAIVTVANLKNCQSFDDLKKLLQGTKSHSLVIKSSQDAGGECMAVINQDNFTQKKM